MSDTTSKDDELREIVSYIRKANDIGIGHDGNIYAYIAGPTDGMGQHYDESNINITHLIKQYGDQRELEGRRIQAEIARDKWNDTDPVREYLFGQFLEGELATLTTKKEKEYCDCIFNDGACEEHEDKEIE